MPDVSTKINDWLNSGEYFSDVDELRTSIMRQAAQSNSESTTALVFEKELYFLIKIKTGIELDIVKEKAVNGINHTFGALASRASGRGRLDAIVNNLIIEYKHHAALKTQDDFEKATQQVILCVLFCIYR